MLSYCTDLDVYLQTENNRLPFADASADLITAVCIFHHVLPPERLLILLDVKRVLKTGGLFVMIEHNPLHPITQWIVRRSPVDKNARLLATGLSRQLMKDAGLHIEGHEYLLYFPEKLYACFGGVENGLRRLPLGAQYAVIGRKIAA
jgi:SAM-dependent methyltransferase